MYSVILFCGFVFGVMFLIITVATNRTETNTAKILKELQAIHQLLGFHIGQPSAPPSQNAPPPVPNNQQK